MTVNISGTTGIDTVNNTALVSKTIQSPTLTGTPILQDIKDFSVIERFGFTEEELNQ